MPALLLSLKKFSHPNYHILNSNPNHEQSMQKKQGNNWLDRCTTSDRNPVGSHFTLL